MVWVLLQIYVDNKTRARNRSHVVWILCDTV